MNSTLSKFWTFVVGAAVGSVTTWLCVKEYYKRIADQEIEDMANYYGERHAARVEDEDDEYIVREEDLPQAPVAEDIRELAKLTKNLGYTDYAKPQAGAAPAENEPGRFEVISPEEFDTVPGYETIELTYYADGVMTDDNEEIVAADEIVGMDPAEHFGEYEDDSVHIRDNRLKIDYEILRDSRAYSDVFSINSPRQAEGE